MIHALSLFWLPHLIHARIWQLIKILSMQLAHKLFCAIQYLEVKTIHVILRLVDGKTSVQPMYIFSQATRNIAGFVRVNGWWRVMYRVSLNPTPIKRSRNWVRSFFTIFSSSSSRSVPREWCTRTRSRTFMRNSSRTAVSFQLNNSPHFCVIS